MESLRNEGLKYAIKAVRGYASEQDCSEFINMVAAIFNMYDELDVVGEDDMEQLASKVIDLLVSVFGMYDAIVAARENGADENLLEFVNMVAAEFRMVEILKVIRREGFEDGIERGIKEGIIKGQRYVLELIEQGLSYEEIKKKIEKAKKSSNEMNCKVVLEQDSSEIINILLSHKYNPKDSVIITLEDGTSRDFTEFVNMAATEFSMDNTLNFAREDGMKKGMKEGKKGGMIKGQNYVLELMEKGLSYEEITKKIEKMLKKK